MKREVRPMTPAEIDTMREGGTRLAPGIWKDGEGNLHFSIPELLQFFGWPNDPLHEEIARAIIISALEQQYPDTTVIETTETDPPGGVH